MLHYSDERGDCHYVTVSVEYVRHYRCCFGRKKPMSRRGPFENLMQKKIWACREDRCRSAETLIRLPDDTGYVHCGGQN